MGQNLVKISLFNLTTTGFSIESADDDETARVNEGRRVSSKSPSLARAGEEEGARKRTRLDLRIPICDYILNKPNYPWSPQDFTLSFRFNVFRVWGSVLFMEVRWILFLQWCMLDKTKKIYLMSNYSSIWHPTIIESKTVTALLGKAVFTDGDHIIFKQMNCA